MDSELMDYFAQVMPDAKAQCTKCREWVEIQNAIKRGGELFCCERCAAILIKSQPPGLKIDGYDL